MEDHYCYLPSIGIFTILGLLLNKTINVFYSYRKLILYIVIILFVPMFSYFTYKRNLVWQTTMTLYNDILSKQPNRFVPLNNRGYLFLQEEEYKKAQEDFEKAIEVKPDYADPYFGIARIYENNEDNFLALKYYNKYVSLNSYFLKYPEKSKNPLKLATALNNKGILESRLEMYSNAIQSFNLSIKVNSNYCDAYYNLSVTYLILNQRDNAIKVQDYLNSNKINCPEIEILLSQN